MVHRDIDTILLDDGRREDQKTVDILNGPADNDKLSIVHWKLGSTSRDLGNQIIVGPGGNRQRALGRLALRNPIRTVGEGQTNVWGAGGLLANGCGALIPNDGVHQDGLDGHSGGDHGHGDQSD